MADMVYTDNAASLLTTTINAVDDPATVSVTSGDGAKFRSIGTNAQNGQTQWFPVVVVRASDNQYEKFKCTARSSDSMTLVRAQGGTAKLAFSVGDYIYSGYTEEALDEFLTAQDAQYGKPHWCGTAGGTANAITATGAPTVAGLSAGLELVFVAAADNTSETVTLQVDSTAAKALKDAAGNSLCISDIVTGGVYRVIYNGSEYRVVSGVASPSRAIAASPLLGFKNRLTNGDMRLDQQNVGAALTFTAAAGYSFCLDQWFAWCTGANVGGQRTLASGIYRYRFTGAASVTAIGFAQRMEAADTYDLAGNTCTLSVKLANALLTTVGWALYYATTEDSFGTYAVPTRTLIDSGSFTVDSTLTKYSAAVAIPSAAVTGLELVLTVGAQISGTWDIAEAQLERGAVATELERVPRAVALLRAQRYWEKSYDDDVAPGAASTANARQHRAPPSGSPTLLETLNWGFKAAKRGTPTITWYSTVTGASAKVRDTSSASDIAVTGTNNGGKNMTGEPTIAGATASHLYEAQWTASARL